MLIKGKNEINKNKKINENIIYNPKKISELEKVYFFGFNVETVK